MFVVAAGRLGVHKTAADGTPVLMREMHGGEAGGLTSMARDKSRSATLIAKTPCLVWIIPKEDFRRISGQRPDVSESVIAFLAAKVRAKTASLAAYMAHSDDQPSLVAMFDAKPYDERAFSQAKPGLPITFLEPKLSEATAPLAAGHPVVCAFVNDNLGRAVLSKLAELGVGLVAMRCAGYNNVDLEAARELGLDVVRVPAYSPHAVAEHATALILALNRKTHRAYNRVRDGNFSLAGLVGFDLFGKTAGIVGLGKIGKCLANILRGFGMDVLAFDAYPDPDYAARSGIHYVDLEEIFSRSDIISLHAPLTPETYHLIDGDRIRRMKPGVLLINTSRGGLVDARALIDGLKSGHIGAAGLDVYEEESEYFFEDRSDQVIADDLLARLMTFNNVLITSHQAFLTTEALANISEATVSSIREWVSGRRGDELSHGVRSG